MFKRSQVIITGSSRGLGKALAEAFLHEGAKVIGLSRSKTIDHKHYKHLKADLSNTDQVKSIDLPIEEGLDAYVLINNAGTLGEVKSFHNLDEQDMIDTTKLNFLAPALLTKKFQKSISNEKGRKYVINIGSGAAYNALDGWSMYCSTKAALSMFSRVAALECKVQKLDLKVVDLSPGVIDTEMQSKIRKAKPSEFTEVERFRQYHQNGELQSASQTADLIIRNFDQLFKNKEGIESLRNYK